MVPAILPMLLFLAFGGVNAEKDHCLADNSDEQCSKDDLQIVENQTPHGDDADEGSFLQKNVKVGEVSHQPEDGSDAENEPPEANCIRVSDAGDLGVYAKESINGNYLYDAAEGRYQQIGSRQPAIISKCSGNRCNWILSAPCDHAYCGGTGSMAPLFCDHNWDPSSGGLFGTYEGCFHLGPSQTVTVSECEDPCTQYRGKQHQDGNYCCQAACGNYCGASNCQDAPEGRWSCCEDAIPHDAICNYSSRQAPCRMQACGDIAHQGVCEHNGCIWTRSSCQVACSKIASQQACTDRSDCTGGSNYCMPSAYAIFEGCPTFAGYEQITSLEECEQASMYLRRENVEKTANYQNGLPGCFKQNGNTKGIMFNNVIDNGVQSSQSAKFVCKLNEDRLRYEDSKAKQRFLHQGSFEDVLWSVEKDVEEIRRTEVLTRSNGAV